MRTCLCLTALPVYAGMLLFSDCTEIRESKTFTKKTKQEKKHYAKSGNHFRCGMPLDIDNAYNSVVSIFRENHIRSAKKTCRYIKISWQKVFFWLQIAPN